MAPNTPPALRGRCLCGAVVYTVSGAFAYAMNCHCSNCRRATGSAFKAIAGIRREQMRVSKGQDVIQVFGAANGAHDVHCARCCSLLYSVVRDGGYVHVAMGTLIDDPIIRPSMHICVGSKASWHEITDALPQFEHLPEGDADGRS